MKSKIIMLTLIVSTLISFSFAQSNVAFYQIEENNYVQFENYIPNTILEYYSTNAGGKQLDKVTTNRMGEAKQTFSVEKTPAFILNRKTLQNPNGDNNVTFLRSKEFVAKNINVDVRSNQLYISCDAQISVGQNIEFQLYKSPQGGVLQKVQTIKGLNSETFQTYTFIESFDKNAIYQLYIVKDGKHIRYTSKNLSTNIVSIASVYPTIFNSTINIDMPKFDQNSYYSIIDQMGKTIRKGILVESHTSLDLELLQAGNYFLSVNDGNTIQNFRITKG